MWLLGPQGHVLPDERGFEPTRLCITRWMRKQERFPPGGHRPRGCYMAHGENWPMCHANAGHKLESHEQESLLGPLQARNTHTQQDNLTCPRACGPRQTLSQAGRILGSWTKRQTGFSNSNGMWCFYLSLGRQRAGFHLIFLCIQCSY